MHMHECIKTYTYVLLCITNIIFKKQVMNSRGGSWGTWEKLEGGGELEVLQIQCIHIQY